METKALQLEGRYFAGMNSVRIETDELILGLGFRLFCKLMNQKKEMYQDEEVDAVLSVLAEELLESIGTKGVTLKMGRGGAKVKIGKFLTMRVWRRGNDLTFTFTGPE